MNTIVSPNALPDAAAASRPRLDHHVGKGTWAIFALLLLGGLGYTAWSISSDYAGSGETATTVWPFILLALALLIALAFEFVNGFHDTANAVATVIYTNSLPPQAAVVWSGLFNFLGVLVSSGAVAFGIISLLPVELILQVAPAPASPWCSRC
jgi:inorganic phosphate transporter, PiT family